MLDNRQGRLVAAGTAPSIAQVSGAFDNRDGEFSTGGDTVLRAGALNNAGGSLLAAEQATLQVTVDGRLDNSARGQIAAGGRADTRGRDAGQPRRRDRACRGGNVVRAGRHAPG
ncbi:hypothetical protein [Xanthomonas massiliensis]|uniref:hypothetical protein n=1 Tax=Xanthomonas massiliensis TaxID=1720302 RepID=UPI003CCDEEBB